MLEEPTAPEAATPEKGRLMSERVWVAVEVYFFGVLGVFLATAPWTALWDECTLFVLPIGWGAWVRSGWVRGLVVGVGVLDLIAAARRGIELRRLMSASEGEERT